MLVPCFPRNKPGIPTFVGMTDEVTLYKLHGIINLKL